MFFVCVSSIFVRCLFELWRNYFVQLLELRPMVTNALAPSTEMNDPQAPARLFLMQSAKPFTTTPRLLPFHQIREKFYRTDHSVTFSVWCPVRQKNLLLMWCVSCSSFVFPMISEHPPQGQKKVKVMAPLPSSSPTTCLWKSGLLHMILLMKTFRTSTFSNTWL